MLAPEALRLADEAVVLDNQGLDPVPMLLFENGAVVWRAEVLPEWVWQLVPLRESIRLIFETTKSNWQPGVQAEGSVVRD